MDIAPFIPRKMSYCVEPRLTHREHTHIVVTAPYPFYHCESISTIGVQNIVKRVHFLVDNVNRSKVFESLIEILKNELFISLKTNRINSL